MVGVQEDMMIINGWNPSGDGVTYTVPGMLTVPSASTISTAYSFATPGNATSAIAAGYAALETAHALGQAYNLVLSPTQWGNLLTSRHPTSNQREMPEILEMLNFGDENGPGRIYVTTALPTGKAVIAS